MKHLPQCYWEITEGRGACNCASYRAYLAIQIAEQVVEHVRASVKRGSPEYVLESAYEMNNGISMAELIAIGLVVDDVKASRAIAEKIYASQAQEVSHGESGLEGGQAP